MIKGSAERVSTLLTTVGHPKSPIDRRVRRLRARLALLALERFDETRFLAADVRACAAMDVDVEVEAAPENVLPEVPFRVRLVDRRLELTDRSVVLAADVDVGRVNPHRPAADDDPLDELVRIENENFAVLERSRLAFVRVDAQVLGLVHVLRNEAPLHPRGETRAAASLAAPTS